ncbi:MAG: hypothetical protein ACK4N5_13440 [Myxococcales bacterium]
MNTLPLFALAAALSAVALLPSTALAHSGCDAPPRSVHAAQPVYHPAQPVYHPAPPAGRYETRATQVWVEGRHEQRWIEGSCVERGNRGRGYGRGRMHCTPGRYETVWVPGYYRTVEQQVWVPYTPNYRRG